MNFTTIAEDLEQMPSTKIITNIFSAFVNNNAAVVHMQLNMPSVALSYLNKAKTISDIISIQRCLIRTKRQ